MNSTSSVKASFLPPVDLQVQALTTSHAMSLNGKKAPTMEQIETTSKAFEGQFVSQMLQSMFSTIDPKDELGGSEEEGTFRSMMLDQYGKSISRAGGIGVAAQIKRAMLQMQETGHATEPQAS